LIKRRRTDFPRRRLREQPISRLFPNMITIAGMCCGLSAIRFAMVSNFEVAVGFILAAAIIDGMDGRIARMLGATSIFGAQLDSLSDFICFGVAPALVMYMWGLHDIRGLGWAVTLFFSVCTALRLARFNTALFDEEKEPWEKQFFVGVPSPAGGILCLLPLVISLLFEGGFDVPRALIACHVVLIGSLMVSRIPTFSGKKQHIKHEIILPFMLICSAILVMFIIEPWFTLSLLSLGYLASIYFSTKRWRQLKAESAFSHAESSSEESESPL
jgi:CDP-diacylglycerol---serine O-phosphatidyltransferase